MQRIIFFSKEDLAAYHMMEKIDEYFKNKQNEKPIESINDILERYHIIEYFENGFIHKNWSEAEIKYYWDIIKHFKRELSEYFKNLSSTEILNFYDEISYEYLKVFWVLVNKNGTFEKISSSELSLIFQKKRFRITNILYCKKIVSYFDKEICEYLLSKPHNAEILLSYFEASHDGPRQEMFFPKSLVLDLREELICRYLDSDDVNLNYIRLIVKNKDSENLRFSDRTRLKAKRLDDKINDELLSSEHAMVFRKSIALSEDQDV